MAQVIVLDFAVGNANVFTYKIEEYPEILDLLNKLHDNEKIASLDDCQWMCKDGEIEIEYETI